MKKQLITLAALLIGSLSMQAQELSPVQLNAPDMNRKATSLMEAFSGRASSVEWTAAKLSVQDLSDLLWAANGINRAESGKRTAPSAVNAQDVDVYVFTEEGAYLYDAVGSKLQPVAKGDFREAAVGARPGSVTPTSQPPVLLVLVSDVSRFTRVKDNDARQKMAAMDAGIVSQNIGVFCAGTGMVTRPRATMDMAKLKEILKLTDTQYPMLNNPVGYAK